MPGCCGIASRKNAAAFVVMALALAVGAIYFVREGIRKPPIEMVEVVVTAKDMPTGTAFTKENVDGYVTTQRIAKANLPHNIVTSREQLIHKRLTRAKHAGEFFNISDLKTKTVFACTWEKDIMSLPFTRPQGSGFVGPGSRVDIVASVVIGTKREVFTLLPDMYVVAVNGEQDITKQQIFPDPNMVSFAVGDEQAKLIELATKLGCNLELLLRHPDAPRRYPTPKTEQAAYDKVFTMLTELAKHREQHLAPPPREVSER